MKKVIYYFSGTGNSLKVAHDLAHELGDTQLIQIRQEKLSEPLNTEFEMIGFVIPSIFSGVPKLVLDFINHLEIKQSSPYLFMVTTHGDLGGTGITFKQIDRLLALKNLTLSACFNIQMPHNMPAKDHVVTAEKREQLFQQEIELVSDIAQAVNSQKQISYIDHKVKSFFEGLTYYGMNNITKKFPFDKGFVVDEKCVSCHRCSEICPADNIEMVDGKPKWKLTNCQFCFACLQWCPTVAIQYKKISVGVERYHQPDIKPKDLIEKETGTI